MFPTHTRRAALAAALLLGPAARASATLLAAEPAIGALREGGLNIYMRHAITDRSQVDTGRLGDRAGQRNLDARGQAQARALGAALQALRVPVGRVFTSAVFRALDTAELAFGRATVLDELVADDYTPRSPAADAAAVRRRLAQRPPVGNDVFVGHTVPLGLILGRTLPQDAFPEGALALLRPDGTGFAELGIVAAETLIEAARAA